MKINQKRESLGKSEEREGYDNGNFFDKNGQKEIVKIKRTASVLTGGKIS